MSTKSRNFVMCQVKKVKYIIYINNKRTLVQAQLLYYIGNYYKINGYIYYYHVILLLVINLFLYIYDDLKR